MEMPDHNTPGSMIRSHREQQSLSLADLSQKTKIPVSVLEAIERDEYYKVSGALYIKSFLRTCASELGLDEAEVLAKYGQFAGELRGDTSSGEAGWRVEDVQISRIGLPWRLIGSIGLALGVVAIGLVWGLRGCENEQGEPETNQANNPVEAHFDTQPETQPLVPEIAAVSALENLFTAANDSLARSFATASIPLKSNPSQARATIVPATKEEIVELAVTDVDNRPVSLPQPLPGSAGFEFAGEEARTIVLRVTSTDRVMVEMKRDAEGTFTSAQWPSAGDLAPPLPTTAIVPGQVYRVLGGFVVYWGARDHFSLKLAHTNGVEVTLNGVRRDVDLLWPGREMLLDIHGR